MPTDDKLKQEFARQFNLDQRPPGVLDRLPPRPTLQQLRDQAGTLHVGAPRPVLSPEQRDVLGGKRSPGLFEAMQRLGEALAKHPEATQATGVSPQSVQGAISLDSAADLLIQSSGLVFNATGDAIRLVAGEGQTLGEKALGGVALRLQAGAPWAVREAFTPALTSYQGARVRTTAAQDRAKEAVAAHNAEADKAKARLADAKSVAQFLLDQKKDEPQGS